MPSAAGSLCALALAAVLLVAAAEAAATQGSPAAASQQQQHQHHQHNKVPCSHMQAAAAARSPVMSVKPTTARRLLQKKYQLSPDPDNKGCYLYRAAAGDTIDDMAKALGLSAAEIRERNSANIADFSRLSGRFIQLCNIKDFSNAEGPGGGPVKTDAQPRLSASNPPPAPAPAPAPKPEPAPAPAPKPEPAPAPAPKPEPTATESRQTPNPTSGTPTLTPTPTPTTTTTTTTQPTAQVGGLPISIGGVRTGGTGIGLPVVGLGRRLL